MDRKRTPIKIEIQIDDHSDYEAFGIVSMIAEAIDGAPGMKASVRADKHWIRLTMEIAHGGEILGVDHWFSRKTLNASEAMKYIVRSTVFCKEDELMQAARPPA